MTQKLELLICIHFKRATHIKRYRDSELYKLKLFKMNFSKETQTSVNAENSFFCPFCEAQVYFENIKLHSAVCLEQRKSNEILCPICLEPIDRYEYSLDTF